jgi:Tol biopolymer transport system component
MKRGTLPRSTLLRLCGWGATATLCALTFSAATAVPALAAFPGANGKIVFQTNRDGNAEIYTMNNDGMGRVNLTRNPAQDIQPRWSPDGGRIVFASNRSGHDEIYLMNADGSGVAQLTFMAGINRRPSWTPAGQILFHNGSFPRSIYLMNADGSNPQNLTGNATDNAYPAASPNGTRIAFSSTRDGTQRLYTMDMTGRNVHLVTPAPPGPEQDDAEANWSPRGNDLVFVRFSESGSEVFLVHKDGSGLTQLTNTASRIEFEPAFSPDGSKIVFHACSGLGTASQHCANYVMNTDGTGETEVTTPRIPYLDTFSDTRIDPFWSSGTFNGTGPTVSEVNGRLEFNVPSSTTNGPSGYATADADMACRLVGDFDVQTDYQLLQWPLLPPGVNGVNLNFGVDFTHTLFVHRSGGFTDVSTFFPDVANTFAPAPDATGSLRLVRSGNILSAYYRNGTDLNWIFLLSAPFTAPDAFATLSIFTNDPPFSHPDVKVANDNFRANSGTFSCPFWWDDSAPDWQPIPK